MQKGLVLRLPASSEAASLGSAVRHEAAVAIRKNPFDTYESDRTLRTVNGITEDIGYWKMTADDFFLVSIAFGGFLIFALVLWNFARIADRKRENRRDPEIRPDVDSPGGANGHGKNEAARSGRPGDILRRLAGPAGIVRHRIDTHETVDAKA